MTSKELDRLEKLAKNNVMLDAKTTLRLIAKIRRLEKETNTWRYSDGMRHPLDMD